MSKSYNMNDLIVDVLLNAEKPLKWREIWDNASEDNKKKYATKGGTPENTLSTNLKNLKINEDGTYSIFSQSKKKEYKLKKFSEWPAYWYIADKNFDLITFSNEIEKKSKKSNKSSDSSENRKLELKLYPFLIKYVFDEYKSRVLDIDDKKTRKGKQGEKKWMHPDLVGFSNPILLNQELWKLQEHIGDAPLVFYSFEMKQYIDFSNLRESYYQAVSNSSWANKGYLVAGKIDLEVYEELKRLNDIHGIGVIELGICEDSINDEDPYNPKTLFEAKFNERIDWIMVKRQFNDDTSVNANPSKNNNQHGFKDFIKSINNYIDSINKNESLSDNEKHLEMFIDVPSDSDIKNYIEEYKNEMNKKVKNE